MADGPIVIVGASLAGLSAARTIRRADDNVPIVLIGDEPHYPYDRPPLSKGFLAGTTPEEKLRLRAAADPDELGVEWRLGTAAVGLDVAQRTITVKASIAGGSASTDGSASTGKSASTGNAEAIEFAGLIIATGARPRQLPGSNLQGVHVLRSLDDARALKTALDDGPSRIVVIGAGFIGAEVAATAREAGHDVTIVEAAGAPLARVLDTDAGMAIADLHREHGVDVRLGVGVSALQSDTVLDDPAVSAVALDDGSLIECDIVVVGIGVIPNTDWLEGSGLTIDNGIVCDDTCVAIGSDPEHPVVAAGDVARWDHHRYGQVRVEQWDNGVEQGAYAGTRVLAALNGEPSPDPYGPVPWFWSDQYDRKIQLAGMPGPTTELIHGDIAERKFVQLYLDSDGEAVGVLAWNRPRHAIQARQFLADGATADEIRTALA